MNKRSFHNAEPSKGESENTWYTPPELIEKMQTKFDLDPCTNSTRPYDIATHNIEHDLGQDGFNMKWSGFVFCNPPYGKETGKWLDKMSNHGNGVALVFSRCETRWAQKALNECDAVNFIKGRISFIKKDKSKSGSAACGSMLLAWGEFAVEAIKRVEGIVFKR
jgi:hypothetical protein